MCADDVRHGIVFRKSLGRYSVHADGRVVLCSISNKLRKHLLYPSADPSSVRSRVVGVEHIKAVDPIAVGDAVSFIDSSDGTGMITKVLPRRTTLSRNAPGGKGLEQVVAANVDQIVAVFAAARPAPKWGLLDRHLVSAESSSLPAVICITKIDLVEEGFLDEVRVYEQIGYTVVLTSAVVGTGLEESKQALSGRLSVLVGKSGVGKTTLLNAIQPDLGLRVAEVSDKTNKGKHTTSHLEMFELDFGGSIIDTPGMREFGVWGVDTKDLVQLFPEMRRYIGRCRFGASCSHSHEPGCVIKQAVEGGEIAQRRYNSYLRLKG